MVGIKIKKKKESDIVKYIDFSNFENKPLWRSRRRKWTSTRCLSNWAD